MPRYFINIHKNADPQKDRRESALLMIKESYCLRR
jgi:hypothetical protein